MISHILTYAFFTWLSVALTGLILFAALFLSLVDGLSFVFPLILISLLITAIGSIVWHSYKATVPQKQYALNRKA